VKKAESVYLGRLQRLGCIVCRQIFDFAYDPPDPSLQLIVIHHVREGQGMSQRAQNWLCIPLCCEHHTGNTGIHKNGNKIPQLKLDEMDLLALTIELYVLTYGA